MLISQLTQKERPCGWVAFLCLLLHFRSSLGGHFAFLSSFLRSKLADLLEPQFPSQTTEAKSASITFPPSGTEIDLPYTW